MGLPVGADFIFFHAPNSKKARPPYREGPSPKEDLSTVVYQNTFFKAPRDVVPSNDFVKLTMALPAGASDADLTITFGSITVDPDTAKESRWIVWGHGGPGGPQRNLETGTLTPSRTYSSYVAGDLVTAYFTDCILGIGVVDATHSETDALRRALRYVNISGRVTHIENGCFYNTAYMEQDIIALPGVTTIGTVDDNGRVGVDTFTGLGNATQKVRVLSLPLVTFIGWYMFGGPTSLSNSIEILCVDNLQELDGGGELWSYNERLKWVLIRNTPCLTIKSRFPKLFNGTTATRGIVGSDGYILNKAIRPDYV